MVMFIFFVLKCILKDTGFSVRDQAGCIEIWCFKICHC